MGKSIPGLLLIYSPSAYLFSTSMGAIAMFAPITVAGGADAGLSAMEPYVASAGVNAPGYKQHVSSTQPAFSLKRNRTGPEAMTTSDFKSGISLRATAASSLWNSA